MTGMPAAPAHLHAIADEVLADGPVLRRRTFALRLDRWYEDLHSGLGTVYGTDAAALEERLVTLAATAYRDRDDDLHELDERRLLEPDWFGRPDMLGYATYTERYAGSLTGLAGRLDHLRELGVGYLHLMPLLQSRAGDDDGGYAVSDYRTVRGDLGTVEDLRALARRLRESQISLVVDLVLNHVAREHAWAVSARAGDPRHRGYFRIFPDRVEPDRFEQSLPEVFPEFAPGSFTFDDDLDGWVWTTFNSWQWDVNWANPDVFAEYADIVFFLANVGVEVLRLDAIAFLWKRLGTDCQNQPEVHAITQALHAVTRIACPAVVFKAEAIVAPNQLVQYLGRGAHYGKVSEIAYHNTLMVQIWSMLATGDASLAAQALRSLPTKPGSAAWVTYVRCHDDIGWAISDEDAAVGRPVRPGPSTVPVRLVRRTVPRVMGTWAGVPVQPGHRRPADQRHRGGAGRPDVGRRRSRCRRRRAPADPAGAPPGARLGWYPGHLVRRRTRSAQRPGLGRRTRSRDRQPVGPPADAGLGRGR